MKAISLWQPWSSLVAIGVKTIETRHYSFHRLPGHPQIGELFALHAAKRRPTIFDMEPVIQESTAGKAWAEAGHISLNGSIAEGNVGFKAPYSALRSGPLGYIVATAVCVASVPMYTPRQTRRHLGPWILVDETRRQLLHCHESPGPVYDLTDQWPYGFWGAGRHAWLLDNVTPLDKPVPAIGRQGWWNWEPDFGACGRGICCLEANHQGECQL